MARILARGKISIVDVSDGYSLSLTSPSVSIPINPDTLLPDFTNAKTNIILYKGEVKQKILVKNIVYSDPEIKTKTSKVNDYEFCLELLDIPEGAKTGYVEFTVRGEDGFEVKGKFLFTVIPQALDIDWIRDWNGTYTKVGENYVVSPRIFAGDREADGTLTGVYLGRLKGFIGQSLPYTFEEAESGIYGYSHDQLVFCINNFGANISGWKMTPSAIESASTDGSISIKSSGAITGKNKNGKASWSLNSDGSASFANGRVLFDKEGNASFDGKITARTGTIGGWLVGESKITSTDGLLQLEASGTIKAATETATAWSLGHNGSASFASGHVVFNADGYAFFDGTIQSEAGLIGGWSISKTDIHNGEVYISSAKKAFVVCASAPPESEDYVHHARNNGGILLYYESPIKYGMQIINKDKKLVAQFGYSNMIGSWQFTNEALYRGAALPTNTSNTFTGSPQAVTFGSRGLRGYTWRLEIDGSGSIARDKIQWDREGNVKIDPSVTMVWDTTNDIKYGTMIFRDPTFYNIAHSVTNTNGQEVSNGIKIYNNPANRTVTLRILSDTSAPNVMHRCLWIQARFQSPSVRPAPGYGGFTWEYIPTVGDKLVVRLIAKIPVGYALHIATNNTDSGETHKWITSNVGTGDWSEYLLQITCQSKGIPSSTAFFYINDLDPSHPVNPYPGSPSQGGQTPTTFTLEWRVAYATIFSVYMADKSTTTITKDGIYTGTLSADQIKAGKLTANYINADNLKAKNCNFEFGSFTGLIKKQKCYIDNSNYEIFSYEDPDFAPDRIFDFNKIGSYIVFTGSFPNGLPILYLPGEAEYLGQIMIFENRSSVTFPLSGNTIVDGAIGSPYVRPGKMAICTCTTITRPGSGQPGYEVRWDVKVLNITNP